MSAQYEILPPGGHEAYATRIFSKIKTYLDSNPKVDLIKTSQTQTADALGNTDSLAIISTQVTGAPTTNHGAFLNVKSVGTPFQLFMPDNAKYIYKRYKNTSTGTYNDWFKLDAGYSDTSGTSHYSNYTKVSRVSKDSRYKPGTTTLAVEEFQNNSANLPSKAFYHVYTSEGTDADYAVQLALGMTADGAYYRKCTSGGWGDWIDLINVSSVDWSNNKLTKTINGTTSDVVSAATILGNLTSSQVTSALGYTPASINTTYDFESSDNSISFMGSAVGSVETVDMTVNGKVSTGGDTISGDYINTADFIEAGVTGKRVTTYGPWGIDIDEYVGTSLWSKLALRDSDILLTKTWDGTHDSLKATIAYLGSQSAVNKVDKAGDTMTGALIMSTANFTPASGKDSTLTAGTSKLYKNGLVISNPATANDQGWVRVLGTAESDTILEIATGDDGGTGEQIVARQYNTSNAVAHQVTLLDTAGNFRCGNTTIYSSGSNGGRNSMVVGDDCKLGDCNVGGMLGLQAVSGSNCGIRLYNSSGGLIGGFQSSNGTPQWINNTGTATTISLNGHTHSYLPLTGGSVTGDTTFTKKVQVNGVFKCAVISRYDNSDSGYVNHVNQDNNAYRPVRASAFTTMSCKHVKTNIEDISDEDAKKLLNLRPVNFDYVEEVGGDTNQVGVLAEDTYKILPKVVSVPDDYVEEDFDITKGIQQPLPSVDYVKFTPYLIKLVQIQQKEINELKTSLNNFMQHA